MANRMHRPISNKNRSRDVVVARRERGRVLQTGRQTMRALRRSLHQIETQRSPQCDFRLI